MKSPDTYIPINCSYYDRLEAWATKKEILSITYLNENEQLEEIEAIILNLTTEQKTEFVWLSNGLKIRLDKLIAINGYNVSKVC